MNPPERRSPECHRVLITGASGYIGSRLVVLARAAGLNVVAAVRNPRRLPPTDGLEIRHFDLADPRGVDDLLVGIDAVIHLAAIIGENSFPPGVDEDLNVSGTRSLLEAARRQGVKRFLFLSSQSAMPDSPTRYGQAKWKIEQMLTGEGEVIIRPGMVTGGPPRGVYGQLLRLSNRCSIIPVVRASAPVYPIHLDDLGSALVELVRRPERPPRHVRFAPHHAMRFDDYLRQIAFMRLGRRLCLVPLSARLVLVLLRVAERMPFIRASLGERVLGLIALRPMDQQAPWSDAGLQTSIRDAIDVVAREGLRRRLLLEGRILTAYCLGQRAASGVLGRYVRAVLAEEAAAPIDLPRLVPVWPGLLRVIEPLSGAGREALRRRLSLALRIVEMTPAGAVRFHHYRRRPLWIAGPVLAWMMAWEAILIVPRLVAERWARRKAARRPAAAETRR